MVTALSDFLRTGFGPSNAALVGVVDGFLATPENLVKGPYLSVALPFQRAAEGGEPFPEIPLGFTPFRHQRTAMERLRSENGRSTVVATGTGSGKTECFLWPVLDHCRREAGTPGIKAILIYPMNALATDQAGRIAATIHRNPALRGRVTAGLFIGEDGTGAPRATAMGPERVIADRETLLEAPPDILLTNYKMLDYLLVRPSDQRLWRRNEPGALRYLVVDELHTFDGAQGTDLACLIRRLRVRLGAVEDLICVGTSATLGETGQEEKLLNYVSAVFKTDFDPDAIVGESRQGIDEFLGETLITDVLTPHPDLAGAADPARFGNSDDYLRSVSGVFFPDRRTGHLRRRRGTVRARGAAARAQRLREPAAGSGWPSPAARRSGGPVAAEPAGRGRRRGAPGAERPLRTDCGGAPPGEKRGGNAAPAVPPRRAAPLGAGAAANGV